MKKELFYLLFIFGGLFPPKIHAQEKSLESLPVKERDSILMAVAKEAILICGPDYYRDHELPEISGPSKWQGPANNKKNDGRKYYNLKYPQDSTKEKLLGGCAVAVSIWADSRDAFEIYFGNAVLVYLDGIDYRHTEMKKNPYQQVKDMPKRRSYISNDLDDPEYDGIRDSMIIDLSKKLIKTRCPDYYRDYRQPEIKTKQFTGEGYNEGKPCYHVIYRYDKKKERFDRDYSVMMEVWARNGTVRRFSFGNGLEIEIGSGIKIWDVNRNEYRGFSTGAFSVPFTRDGLKLKPSRKTIDLDKLTRETRDSILIKQAKEILLAIGPTYLRGYQRPLTDTVTRVNVGGGQSRPYYQSLSGPSIKEEYRKQNEQYPGRKFYEVQFKGGISDLVYTKPRIAMIKFWANTGDPFCITLGNTVAVYFDGLDYRKIGVNVPYEDRNTVKSLNAKNKTKK